MSRRAVADRACEHRRADDLGLQRLQGLLDDPSAQGFLLFGGQLGIAERDG